MYLSPFKAFSYNFLSKGIRSAKCFFLLCLKAWTVGELKFLIQILTLKCVIVRTLKGQTDEKLNFDG